jgi:exopolyphosphatase/guanosine-5'-triphosphate,3'-diphosphate pyrophosphatase
MDQPLAPLLTKRLAAIDVGSNSVRLMVAEASADGSYRILDDHKETTRLAHGLVGARRLTPEAIYHTVDALKRMKAIVEGYQVERLAVIATSAVREAVNGPEFVDYVRQQLGLEIQVIPPGEEGDLSYRSAAAHFDLGNQQVVVVDLGGGSAELVFAARGFIEEIYSLPIGAVRLTESCIRNDPPVKDDYQLLKRRIRRALQDALGNLTYFPHVMIGAGGTFTALANISLRSRGKGPGGVGGYEMNRAEVRQILERLRHMTVAERRGVAGLNPDRADIIVAGLVVIERLMKWLRLNRLVIHDKGVRDGLLRKLIDESFGRVPAVVEDKADPIQVVQEFGKACGFEAKHAQQVARLAGQLFDQLAGPLKLPPGEKLLLEAAAWLHEVGALINYQKHHEHSYHLIKHGNLRSFSPQQRELIANIARYHRKAPPKPKHKPYARLTPGEQATVRRLSALLRVADGLDRTHTQRISNVRCENTSGIVRITVEAPTSPAVDLWGSEQKGKLFEKVFGKKLVFAWQVT